MKILVIRLSSIGDIVLATPVLRCLHEQLAQAQVHVLTKPQFAAILTANPHVDKVISYASDGTCLSALKQEGYDYVVDLQRNHRSKRVVRRLGVRSSTYNKEDVSRILYVVTKKDFCSGRSVVQRYFEAVKPLGIIDDAKGLEYYTEDDTPCLEQEGLLQGGKGYAVLVCGAQHYTKQMPPQQILILCRLIHSAVVLLGGMAESRRWQEYLVQHPSVQWPQNALNCCGKTTLAQSALLIRRSSVVITPDTGMMHIAAAYQKPILAVWGNTTPRMGFFPYLTPHIDFQVEGLRCRPCSRFGKQRCPKGHFRCMMLQNWPAIAAQVNKLIHGTEKADNRQLNQNECKKTGKQADLPHAIK